MRLAVAAKILAIGRESSSWHRRRPRRPGPPMMFHHGREAGPRQAASTPSTTLHAQQTGPPSERRQLHPGHTEILAEFCRCGQAHAMMLYLETNASGAWRIRRPRPRARDRAWASSTSTPHTSLSERVFEAGDDGGRSYAKIRLADRAMRGALDPAACRREIAVSALQPACRRRWSLRRRGTNDRSARLSSLGQPGGGSTLRVRFPMTPLSITALAGAC